MKFPAALLAAAAIALFGAAAAEAKQTKLDGRLVAGAVTKGSKVSAPVLLSEKTAKKLKLRSPLATLTTKGSKTIPAPNPAGSGTIEVAPSTMRSGDALTGRAKLKGSAKKLMPKIKGKRLEITDRESAYSVDELTAAVVALYQQVGALGLRVDTLETSFDELRAELEQLKAQNAALAAQIDAQMAQMAALETALDDLTSIVDGLPTQADLDAVIADIADLQADLAALDDLVTDPTTGLQAQLDGLDSELTTIQGDVAGLLALCAPPSPVEAFC